VKTLAILPFILLLTACGGGRTLPSYGVVPHFTLTDQNGSTFDSRTELQGKVWLANFMFTTCNGPCPRMTTQFRKIRDDSRSLNGFRLVSFTIDPKNDTPEVLDRYGKAFGAEPQYWAFLTGRQADLNRLSYDVFHLAKVDGSLEHSTRFVLVDGQSRIRGYYDSSDEDSMRELTQDIRQLVGG
jgi:cytochrome oxidase Cu insertion factor (SCO1/SenC/PrrC family)